MTYTQAKLIVWNADAYTREQVRQAAVFVLGSLGASQEDVDQACMVT